MSFNILKFHVDTNVAKAALVVASKQGLVAWIVGMWAVGQKRMLDADDDQGGVD